MSIGELISLYRKEANLTIDELVNKSGVPKGTLNKIINGTTKAPTLDNIKAIARALNKTLSDFDDLPQKNAPSEADEAIDINETMELFSQLPHESQQQVLSYMKFLNSGDNKPADK